MMINAPNFFAFVQINTFRLSQAVSDLVSSASGLTCIHECGPGYECKYGLCQRRQCTQDCKDAPKQQLCGSNGVTYNSLCEMEKARCVEALDITKLYDGVCKLMEWMHTCYVQS